jgi:porin
MILKTVANLAKTANPGDSTEVNKIEKSDQISIQKSSKAFTTEASYTGDICTNLFGGITTGTKYLGMANLKVGFYTQNARLWKGGQLFINGAVTHGQSPTAFLVGDFQAVSNIDAGDHIYIHELWYKHQFKRFEITFGLQDLNIEFAGSDNGGMFINSSFGIPPVISDNIPAPIFPLTALGITTKIRITENVSLSAVVYDGCPTAFEHNVYNTNWHIGEKDGTLVLSEIQYAQEISGLPGLFKAGYYYHTGLAETDSETGETTEVFENNYGFYFIADQTVLENADSDRSIGVFAQLALSPAVINNHHYYFGGGINYFGISKKQPEDALGIAVACAGFNKSYKRNESTIEAYYKKQIGENFSIQPDLQYVIHPAGTDEILPNALVGILRFNISF